MEPVTWMKAKYTAEKTKGRYKSSSSGSSSGRKHKKMPQKQKPTMQRVMVLTGANLKTTWTWRAV